MAWGWATIASLAKERRKAGQEKRGLMYDTEAPAVLRRIGRNIPCVNSR
jgi:hypothetical protein